MNGYIAVDLDGTLAHYEGWDGGKIGEPIPLMVERVKGWLQEGKDVRIFTARVAGLTEASDGKIIVEISDWCEKHIGQRLPITCEKDFGMIELWDDRCKQVERNTGELIAETRYNDGFVAGAEQIQERWELVEQDKHDKNMEVDLYREGYDKGWENCQRRYAGTD